MNGRSYCQQEHVEGDVTYWCELRSRHEWPVHLAPARVPSEPPCHCWYDGPPCPRHNEDGSARVPSEEG